MAKQLYVNTESQFAHQGAGADLRPYVNENEPEQRSLPYFLPSLIPSNLAVFESQSQTVYL